MKGGKEGIKEVVIVMVRMKIKMDKIEKKCSTSLENIQYLNPFERTNICIKQLLSINH